MLMDDLDDVAAELGQRAAQVEAAGDQLVRAASVAIWTSTAADAFRAQVARRNLRCIDLAAELRSAASVVVAYADAVAAEKALLARMAEAAEAATEAAAVVGSGVIASVGRLVNW